MEPSFNRILNYGLLIITALVACRFFDTDLISNKRGIICSVGIGFFCNKLLCQKRKSRLKENIIICVFLVALVQLFVPQNDSWQRRYFGYGKEINSKLNQLTQTTLSEENHHSSLEEDVIEIQNEADWIRGEIIYVFLKTDNEGFAKKLNLFLKKKMITKFFKTKVSHVTGNGSNKLTIISIRQILYGRIKSVWLNWHIVNATWHESNSLCFGNIKDGEAVLKDVLINGISIRELKKEREKTKKMFKENLKS